MSSPHDRSTPLRARPPAAELLPVLVWLNRRELASRFPAWQPHPHAGEGEHDASASVDAGERGEPR